MKTIILSKPLAWGDERINELTLRRPVAGDLRGIKLAGIGEMDVNTILALVPRISITPLAPDTLTALDPVDVMAVCEVLAGFFTTSYSPSPTTH